MMLYHDFFSFLEEIRDIELWLNSFQSCTQFIESAG